MYIDDVCRQPIEKAINETKPERQILPNSPIAVKSPIILPSLSFIDKLATIEKETGWNEPNAIDIMEKANMRNKYE